MRGDPVRKECRTPTPPPPLPPLAPRPPDIPSVPVSPPPSTAVSPLSSHLPTLLTRVVVIEVPRDSFWPCGGRNRAVGEQQSDAA